MMQDFAASGIFLLLVAASLHLLWFKEAPLQAVGVMTGLWITFRCFFKDMRLRFTAAILMAGVISLALAKIEDTFIIAVWVTGLSFALVFEVREIARKGRRRDKVWRYRTRRRTAARCGRRVGVRRWRLFFCIAYI